MQRIAYYFAYALLWLVSILPFPIFYFVSDCVKVIVYYVIGYRKGTVRSNIKLAFPNLSEKERLAIEKKSYRHLCDMFMEMAKTMLLKKDITIAEISTKMGYTYPTHFSSAFKKYFGYLPNKLKSGKLSVLVFAFDFSWIGEFLLVF